MRYPPKRRLHEGLSNVRQSLTVRDAAGTLPRASRRRHRLWVTRRRSRGPCDHCRRGSIFVFAVGYVTEGRLARRRRLDEKAVNAAIAFVSAASKRRRQLGVLNSMSRRPSLADKNVFQLDPPPEDVGAALKRYALILDDYGEAEARVRFFLPPSLYGDLYSLNEMHSNLRAAIVTTKFDEHSAKVDGER
jgi:hypothetical protein